MRAARLARGKDANHARRRHARDRRRVYQMAALRDATGTTAPTPCSRRRFLASPAARLVDGGHRQAARMCNEFDFRFRHGGPEQGNGITGRGGPQTSRAHQGRQRLDLEKERTGPGHMAGRSTSQLVRLSRDVEVVLFTTNAGEHRCKINEKERRQFLAGTRSA